MKSTHWILATLLTSALFLIGCSDSGSETKVNPAPVEKSFASAEDPTVKATADKAVALVKEGNYAGALKELQTLSANAKLTEEQKKAVTDVVAQVQKALTETMEKATGEANKALGDMQKSLGK